MMVMGGAFSWSELWWLPAALAKSESMYTKSKGKQERDWSVQPYSLADVEVLPTFVSELEDHLTDKDGILRLCIVKCEQ